MGGSGLDQTDYFQKFADPILDRIQYLRIRIGLGLKIFTVCSALQPGSDTVEKIAGIFTRRIWQPYL